MKRIVMLGALIGTLALTSCVNENEEYYTTHQQNAQKISFVPPVAEKSTRAWIGDVKTTYPIKEDFSVYGMFHKGSFTKWAAEGNTLYIDNQTCHYDASVGGWSPWDGADFVNIYWPSGGKLTFAAYSPARAKTHGTVSYGTTGLQIADFVVRKSGYAAAADNTTDAIQYDLMYSERSYDKTSSTGSGSPYSGVDLKFHHALSKVTFSAKTSIKAVGAEVRLKKIVLTNVARKGTFNETITENNTTYESAPAWTLSAPVEKESEYVVFYSKEGLILSETKTAVGNNFILLPQDFTAQNDETQVMTVTWTMKSGAGTPIEQSKTVKLSDIKFTSNTDPEAKWYIGRSYAYNLSIGMDKIFFNPIVGEDWSATTGGDITL